MTVVVFAHGNIPVERLREATTLGSAGIMAALGGFLVRGCKRHPIAAARQRRAGMTGTTSFASAIIVIGSD